MIKHSWLLIITYYVLESMMLSIHIEFVIYFEYSLDFFINSVYKEHIEEMEQEMEIGYPTDVKHVTHIGLDGSTTTNNVKGWDNLKPPELLSINPITLKQFELAMATQAHQPHIDDSFPNCD